MNPPALSPQAGVIVSAGACNAVGRYLLASAAAVRAGISGYADHPFMLDRHGEPMIVARATWLADDLPAAARMLHLAVAAARETLQPLAPRLAMLRGHLRLYLALSAATLAADARDWLLAHLLTGLGLAVETAPTVVIAGHAGGLLALASALSELQRGEALACLVGGVDSWLVPEVLEALDVAGRLHSRHTTWGFTPGEGAAWVLLTTAAGADHLGLAPRAEVCAAGSAEEPVVQGGAGVCTGVGLSAALQAVLTPTAPVDHTWCDFNGETYRADEYGFSVCRTRDGFRDPDSVSAPAASWGDVGAAAAPLALTLPLAAWARGYARGPEALVFASSATLPARAAVRLRQCPAVASP